MANTAQSKDRAAVKGGLDDLLGNVIRNDRQRAGRGEPSAASEPPVQASEPPVQPALSPVMTPEPPAAAPVVPVSFSEAKVSSQTPDGSRERSDNMTDTHYDNITSGQKAGGDQSPQVAGAAKTEQLREAGTESTPKPAVRPAQARRKVAGKPAQSSESPKGRLAERIAAAAELAATQTITVTLRIPHGFNEWLDGYVHGAWPEKIRKQELVVEGLMLAYARRGLAGEEIMRTALLGESEEDEGS